MFKNKGEVYVHFERRDEGGHVAHEVVAEIPAHLPAPEKLAIMRLLNEGMTTWITKWRQENGSEAA